MTIEEKLGASALFGLLPEPVLARLAPWCEGRAVKSGEVLLQEGETSSRLYLVISGTVVVCKRLVDTTDTVVARLGPGAHLGEIDLLDAETATASAIMATDGEVVQLDAERFRRMLVVDRPLFSHVARVLFVELAERVRATNDRVRQTIAWGLDVSGEPG